MSEERRLPRPSDLSRGFGTGSPREGSWLSAKKTEEGGQSQSQFLVAVDRLSLVIGHWSLGRRQSQLQLLAAWGWLPSGWAVVLFVFIYNGTCRR